MRPPLALLLALTAAACGPAEPPLPPAGGAGELVVLTVAGPTTFFHDPQGRAAGIEHDLVVLFAREIGKTVRFTPVERRDQVLPLLARQRAHLAAAGLTVHSLAGGNFRLGPAYRSVRHHLAYNTDRDAPKSPPDLAGHRVEIVSGSGYESWLREWQKQAPALRWTAVPAASDEGLLAKLADGIVDFVITDTDHLDRARLTFPNLASAFEVGRPSELAWVFPASTDAQLLQSSWEFFARIERDGTLKRLLDRYYGHLRRLSSLDVETFLRKVQAVLPRYRAEFQRAGDISQLDWRLLAALGYQESQWNPLATSPTGVRGLMMLTEDTADRLKVSDRLDARQSIRAGARYLADLRDQLPGVPEPDRTWLAVAAYNLGMGHLQGGRQLAPMLRLNPDSWPDMKKMLPLMSRPEYAARLKSGPARGGEAVIMTENVRSYYDILARIEPREAAALPRLGSPAPDWPLVLSAPERDEAL